MNQDEMPEKFYSLLSSKFNILDKINFVDFDKDFNVLYQRLEKCKKPSFDSNDRIIIEHQDTDFYFEYCSVGINLYNFFQVVQSLDIPCYVFLFFTNHVGLAKELDLLCKNPNNKPAIIESFISKVHYRNDVYENFEINVDSISHQALLLARTIRSHRNAIVNSLRDIDDQHIMRSITNQ